MKKKVTKICNICNTPKPLEDFVKHSNYKDKHTNICKECNKNKYHSSFRNKVLESLERIENKINKKI